MVGIVDAYTIVSTSKPSVFRGTWLGRPGTSTEYRLGWQRDGLRVIEHRWDDESTVSIRVIEGTAMKPLTFREYLNIEDVQPGQGAALAMDLRTATLNAADYEDRI